MEGCKLRYYIDRCKADFPAIFGMPIFGEAYVLILLNT